MWSTVLEVAVGMTFCYASMALIASGAFEAGASLLKLRAGCLLDLRGTGGKPDAVQRGS